MDIEVIGVIFDLTLRHETNGKRVLDNVKTALIDFFRTNFKDDDIMYLYHPEIEQPVNRIGAQVAAISNYETDGWKFDLNLSLRQTLFILAAEPYEAKTLLLVSDRLTDLTSLKKIASINNKDMLGCRLLCVDIGNHLSDCDYIKIAHVVDSNQLMGVFKELYAENDNCVTDNNSE